MAADKRPRQAIIWLGLAAYLLFASVQVSGGSSRRHEENTKEQQQQQHQVDEDNKFQDHEAPESPMAQLNIDAMDLSLCGEASFRDWQMSESAFGCAKKKKTSSSAYKSLMHKLVKDGRDNVNEGEDEYDDHHGSAASGNIIKPRIINGEHALEGEFPFFVRLSNLSLPSLPYCGGTLIHKDLVITAAHCVFNKAEIELSFGSNERMIPRDRIEKRKAHKWCWPNEFVFRKGELSPYDVAVIRLDKPVDYVPYKISPACLWPDRRHLNEAICAVAGFGGTGKFDYDNEKIVEDEEEPQELQTLKLRRSCEPIGSLSCYTAASGAIDQSAYKGDSGGPLVCYDRCPKFGNALKAFVVGNVSGGGNEAKALENRSQLENYFLDFNKAHEAEYLVDLIRETQRERGTIWNHKTASGKNFKCVQAL